MDTLNKIDDYLNERAPSNKDYIIKDIAGALTAEIEQMIENSADDFFKDDDFDGDTLAKIINLSLKNVNKNTLVKNILYNFGH